MNLFDKQPDTNEARLLVAGFLRQPGRSGEPVPGYWRRYETDGWRTYSEAEALALLTPEADAQEGE